MLIRNLKTRLLQIKCKHDYQYVRSFFINGGMEKLHMYECTKCNKQKLVR